MNKCKTIDDAEDILVEAFDKASRVSDDWDKLNILFTAYNEIAKGLPPSEHLEALDLIKEYLQESSVLEAMSAGFQEVFSKGFSLEKWRKRNEHDVWGDDTEEIINRRAQVKKEFLLSKFQDPNSKVAAGRAKLYFEREMRQLIIQTFLVDRENGQLVANHEIGANARRFKLKLLNQVIDYLKQRGYTDVQIGNSVLWNDGNELISKILKPGSNLRNIIEQELTLGRNINTRTLKDTYEKYKNNGDQKAKTLIDAYNAWIMLDNFDAVTTMLAGEIVKPGPKKYNQIDNEEYYTKIDRATNMWGNAFGDEVENIADLISEVALVLIQTSRTYNWKSDIPREDRYLAFLDFNYIIGKVKKLNRLPISKTLKLDETSLMRGEDSQYKNLSEDTKRVLRDITRIKLECGYKNGLESPTFYDLISYISENPQRHLHSVFDILTNTDIIEYMPEQFLDEDKNLIWTLSKELFGTWEGQSRSLYDLHKKSDGDRIFEIITLVADSMFAESYLQYYEDEDGRLRSRYLEDYAVSILRKELMYDMRLATGFFDLDKYNAYREKYKILYKTRQPLKIFSRIVEGGKREIYEGLFLRHVQTTITDSQGNDLITIGYGEKGADKLDPRRSIKLDEETVWKSAEFRAFIKDTIGIDFNNDSDFTNAYEETFRENTNNGTQINYYSLLDDITRICGAVMFNLGFNNFTVPYILKTSKHSRNLSNVKKLIDLQYLGMKSVPQLNKETGVVEILSVADLASYLRNLALAKAINQNVMTSAQVKTGEGTSLASQCLSRLRNSYHYQLFTQNRRINSATRGTTFVEDVNGFYEGVDSRREVKTNSTTKSSTDFSAVESFTTSFLCDWVSAFTPKHKNSALGGGHAAFIPTVNSDKSQMDILRVNMNAKSRFTDKAFVEMTDLEIEQELKNEFGDMYDRIVTNINSENLRLATHLGIDISTINTGDPIASYDIILLKISDRLCDDDILLNLVLKKVKEGELYELIENGHKLGLTSSQIIDQIYTKLGYEKLEKKYAGFRKTLAGVKKNRIVDLMHKTMVAYNRTHRRQPIQTCEHIHYLFAGDGSLKSNDTLVALWGRMKGTPEERERLGINKLYPKGREKAASLEGFFKYEKDLRMVQDLIKDGFEIYLYGNPAKDLEEIEFLRNEFADWITDSGKMALCKINGIPTNDLATILEYANDPVKIDLILVHPMITKMNRMQYLATQLYTCAVGGAHYVYKGGGKNVLEEESARWLASNKRNVCYASTVHKFQNNTLNGVPRWYQLAILEDIKSDIYSIMGDLDSHKPIDGGMFVNPWFSPLENSSLAGESAGLDKKQFGTFYYEEYAAGGIVKTAGFASTNARMRRSEAWRNLTKNMTNRTWIKEFTDKYGNDIEEIIDITKDYKGNIINWILDDKGAYTYYSREIGEGKLGLFRLGKIESLGNNKYKIYEFPVKSDGEIDETNSSIQELLLENPTAELQPILRTSENNPEGIIEINNNWDLFNQVFGGYHSLLLSPNGELEGSEHSVNQMVLALNSIGYERTIANNDDKFGDSKYTEESFEKIESQEELWQPLKYSDISYAPNIGAIKSTQMNVNPKEGMYEDMFLNAMNMKMGQLGIQLDKEHHADDSEVSMPTLIIQACANKGYTIHYSSKLYKSLSTLTELAIQDCMDGIMEIMPGNTNTGKLLTEVANIIVDKLVHSLDDGAAVSAAMDYLIKKAKNGLKASAGDVIGKIAWSDPKQYNKIYSDLASHLTNSAIKMKFSGTLSVICPTERMEQMYGNKRLDAYTSYKEGAFTELIALQMELDEIRNRTIQDDQMIYIGSDDATTLNKLNAASNLNTLHHYWIEWSDGTKESITINVPSKYYQIKKWLTSGNKGKTITKIYENITKGRELGAFNARFKALELGQGLVGQQFCIFDLDSIHDMFAFNDLDVNIENAESLMRHRVIAPQLKRAQEIILKLLKKNDPEAFDILAQELKTKPNADPLILAKVAKIEKSYADVVFKVAKVLIYKEMELDLFKISKDYLGERKVWVNEHLITVNPETIKTQAYELIMPKVYLTRFGLQEYDLVESILKDLDFFTKRAINKLKLLHVPSSCFDYELKQFNGRHIYIFDSRKGQPNEKLFLPSKNFFKFEENDGSYSRVDVDGELIHGLSSKDDKVMTIGKAGYEVIVTDNPEYYLLNLSYNMVTFSDERVDEGQLLHTLSLMKDTNTRSGKKFLRSFTTKSGKLIPFKNIKARNKFIANLTLDPPMNAPKEVFDLIEEFTTEGKELHASFNKSLDILAGRIPAQSLQSFMPQRVVAFDNNNINTAYVSTFLLFLQGSDLDIDAVTLLGSEFDDSGRYVMWSPLADISTIERLEASLEMPFPTGLEINPTILNNKDSFYITYNDYFRDLFDIEYENIYDEKNNILGRKPVANALGSPVLKIKDNNPETLKLLGKFLEDVTANGLNIKGKIVDGKWESTKEALDEINEDFEINGVLHHKTVYLARLGFNTVAKIANAMKQVKDMVDKHNLYIKTASPKTREMMAKNQCLWNMMLICSTPSNLVELMVGVDVSTAPIKDKKTGAVAQSPWADSDKYAAYGGEYTKHLSILEGQIGKQCVGIGAVSIKVNSTTQYYMDHVLREGSEELKERLLLPFTDKYGRRSNKLGNGFNRGYDIDGKRYYGLANLYDKSTETATDTVEIEVNGEKVQITTSQKNAEIIKLLDSILAKEDITPNVAMSLAAMLSVAVDNAKDLALAKINAGPKMFGFYAYGISLGMDIRDLAKIINSELGRAISKICEGNIINGEMGAFSALQAIAKLEGQNLYNDFIAYDITAISKDKKRATTIPVGLKGKLTSCRTASEALTRVILDYYNITIKENKKNKDILSRYPNVKKKLGKFEVFNDDNNLGNMIYQISLLGKMDECINWIKTSPNSSYESLIKSVKDLDNAKEWAYSFNLLLEKCSKYGQLQSLFRKDIVKLEFEAIEPYHRGYDHYHHYAKDLKTLAEGAEEMRVLGSILSSNKGVKSKIEEGINFIRTIEDSIINRKKQMDLPISEDDKLDFILFCTDSLYRENAIKKYEEVKHTVNILDVISTAPHFLSYLRTCGIPYAAFRMGSSKFRTRLRYLDAVIDALDLKSSKDKENAVKGIENAVNYRMLKEWLANKNLKFILPKGNRMFVGRNEDTLIVKEDTPIPLSTDEGLATFKLYMDSVIIPGLKADPTYSHNSFVLGLTTFGLTKTGTHAEVKAYTLSGKLMPHTESEEILFLTYQGDFTPMHDKDFDLAYTDKNSIASYADAFYIYSLYVFGGKRGLKSLIAMFDDSNYLLAESFEDYEAELDANSDFIFELEDLCKWAAPNGNIYHPNAKYIYANDTKDFGTLYMERQDMKALKSPDGEDVEETDADGNPRKKKIVRAKPAETQMPLENRQNILVPSAVDKPLELSAYTLKTNNNIRIEGNTAFIDLGNDMSINLVANEETAEFSFLPNGELDPINQKIVNIMNKNIDIIYSTTPNLETGEYERGISETHLQSLLDEARKFVNNEC